MKLKLAGIALKRAENVTITQEAHRAVELCKLSAPKKDDQHQVHEETSLELQPPNDCKLQSSRFNLHILASNIKARRL